MMSPEAHATLQEIVTIARDGKEFYEYAGMVTADETLRQRFMELAAAKSDVVALVATRLRALREPELTRREFRVGVRTTLTKIRGLLEVESPAMTLRELARLEDHLIYHYNWVLAGTADSATRRELDNLLPVMQRCRDAISAATTRLADC